MINDFDFSNLSFYADVEVLQTRFDNDNGDWSGEIKSISWWKTANFPDFASLEQDIMASLEYGDWHPELILYEDTKVEYVDRNQFQIQCSMKDDERDEPYIIDVQIWVYKQYIDEYIPQQQEPEQC